jgi:hypothetical protein
MSARAAAWLAWSLWALSLALTALSLLLLAVDLLVLHLASRRSAARRPGSFTRFGQDEDEGEDD